jgi:hypothetical protein
MEGMFSVADENLLEEGMDGIEGMFQPPYPIIKKRHFAPRR